MQELRSKVEHDADECEDDEVAPKKQKLVQKKGSQTSQSYTSAKPNYRSNLYSVIHHVKTLKFNNTQKQSLEKFCPFWKLIYSILNQLLTTTTTRKNDQVIFEMVKSYNEKKKGFNIAGEYKMIETSDIAKIFGISIGKNKVELGKMDYVNSPFYQKYFVPRKKPNLIGADIVECLGIALKGRTENDFEDVVRLMTLLFLPCVFLPTKGGSIPWSYIQCVLDVKALKKYDWAGHIGQTLVCNIAANCKQPENVTGCVVALPYWLMENYHITQKIGSDANMWCLKWSLSELNALSKKNVDILGLCLEACVDKYINNETDELDDANESVEASESVEETELHGTDDEADDDDEEEDDEAGNDDDDEAGDEAGDETKHESMHDKSKMQQLIKENQEKDKIIFELRRKLAAKEEEILELKKKISDFELTREKDQDDDVFWSLNSSPKQSNDVKDSTIEIVLNVANDGKEAGIGVKGDGSCKEVRIEEVVSVQDLCSEKPFKIGEFVANISKESASNNADIIKEKDEPVLTEKQATLGAERDGLETEEVVVSDQLSFGQAFDLDQCVMKISKDARVACDEADRIMEKIDPLLYGGHQSNSRKESFDTQIPEMSSDDLFVLCAENVSQELKAAKGEEKLKSTVPQDMEPQPCEEQNIELGITDEVLLQVAQDVSQKMKATQQVHITENPMVLEDSKKNVGSIEKNVKVRQNRKVNRRKSYKYASIRKKPRTKANKYPHVEDAPNFSLFGDTEESPQTNDEGTPACSSVVLVEDTKPKSIVKKKEKPVNMLHAKSGLVPFITDEEYHTVRAIHIRLGTSTIVWRNNPTDLFQGYATLEDVYTVLDSTRLSNNVVNTHAQLLMRQHTPNDESYFFIIDGLCLTYITSDEKYAEERTQKIDNVLKQHVDKPWTKLMFPIVAQDHWTLLVLDNDEAGWVFYNSLKPRSAKTVDPYEANAMIIKGYVENKLKEIMMQNEKYHQDDASPSHTGLTQDSFDWDFYSEKKNEISQQGASLDCGVYVCFWMTCIARNEEIPATISAIDLGFFKGNLVSALLGQYNEELEPYFSSSEEQSV